MYNITYIYVMYKYVLTLHLTNFFATLIVASQKAPLYLALTSVPTLRKGGSSLLAYEKKEERG